MSFIGNINLTFCLSPPQVPIPLFSSSKLKWAGKAGKAFLQGFLFPIRASFRYLHRPRIWVVLDKSELFIKDPKTWIDVYNDHFCLNVFSEGERTGNTSRVQCCRSGVYVVLAQDGQHPCLPLQKLIQEIVLAAKEKEPRGLCTWKLSCSYQNRSTIDEVALEGRSLISPYQFNTEFVLLPSAERPRLLLKNGNIPSFRNLKKEVDLIADLFRNDQHIEWKATLNRFGHVGGGSSMTSSSLPVYLGPEYWGAASSLDSDSCSFEQQDELSMTQEV